MNKLTKDTIENLKSLGIYQPEFDTTVEIYCSMVEQYQNLERNFKKQKFEIVGEKNTKGTQNEDPIMKAMERLRKDILSYSSALGLTPSSLKRIKSTIKEENKEPSKLEKALTSFGI